MNNDSDKKEEPEDKKKEVTEESVKESNTVGIELQTKCMQCGAEYFPSKGHDCSPPLNG